jgi:hypothetical protein
MQPLPGQATAPAEDLDDVLGRFNTWAKAHKESNKRGESIDGIRELCYEEALESTRRRWQSHRPSTPFAMHEETAKDDLLGDNDVLADKLTLSSSAPESPARSSTAQRPVAASFGDVLAETATPGVDSGSMALVWPAAAKAERQVSMSLRASVSEQALIKARAAEAGLSVSAYLRHCALEVEKLRNQVHHTLALIEQRAEQSPAHSLTAAQAPAGRSQSGFFSRLRQLVFGGPARLTLGA